MMVYSNARGLGILEESVMHVSNSEWCNRYAHFWWIPLADAADIRRRIQCVCVCDEIQVFGYNVLLIAVTCGLIWGYTQTVPTTFIQSSSSRDTQNKTTQHTKCAFKVNWSDPAETHHHRGGDWSHNVVDQFPMTSNTRKCFRVMFPNN